MTLNDKDKIYWVQGNDQTLLIPLEREVIPQDGDPYTESYYPDQDAVVTVSLVGEWRKYSFTPVVEGNLLTVNVHGNIAAGAYGVEVVVVNPNQTKMRSLWSNQVIVTKDNAQVLQEWDEFKQLDVKARAAVFFFSKGDPFTYDDFTPEQIADLKKPATDAAAEVAILEGQIEQAEQGRVDAESLRVQAETQRVQAETARAQAETLRANAEQGRADAESSRVQAETLRVQAEQGRVDAESLRVQAETQRVQAETARAQAETLRANAEQGRADAESSRVQAETLRVQAEQGRTDAEALRVTAENGRSDAEALRASAEQTRQQNESSRITTSNADHQTATSDHTTATSDHSAAVSDHSTAASDHTQATNDHSASVEATAGASNVNATVNGLVVTITDRTGVSRSVNIGFEILNTYSSVAAMNADAANVQEGVFVMIATTDPTSAENARLYVRNSNAPTSSSPFSFLSDLDQAATSAFADWLENYKPTIEGDHTRAVNDHTQAGIDHQTAAADHTQAGTDHETAAADHTQAGTDHTASETATGAANAAAELATNKATEAGRVNATINGTILTVTDRNGQSSSVNTKGDKGDPSTADINLNGSVITVTNNAGQTSSIDLLDATEERVQITVTKAQDAPSGTTVSGLVINAYYNDASVPTAAVTTDANGMAVLRVPNGYKYRLVFPSQTGCETPWDVVHTAAVSQRSVEVEYMAASPTPLTEEVTVVLKNTAGVAQSGKTVTCSVGGSETQQVTDSSGEVTFEVALGSIYTITAPQIEGFYVRGGDYSVSHTADRGERIIVYIYRIFVSGVFIVTGGGDEYTLEQFQQGVEQQQLQKSDALLIKVATQALQDAGGVFCFKIADIVVNTLTKKQWSPNTSYLFRSIPSNGNNVNQPYYYDGKTASALIQEEGDQQGIETPAVDWAMGQTVEVDGVTYNGFLMSIGQWDVAWGAREVIDDIIYYLDPTYKKLSFITGGKWSSAQSGTSKAWYYTTLAGNSDSIGIKYVTNNVLPAFAV